MLVLLASLAIFVRYTSATCKAFEYYGVYRPLDTCYEVQALEGVYVSAKYTCSETTGGYEVIPMTYSQQACGGDGTAEDPGEYDTGTSTFIYKQCNGDDDECWCDASACSETAEKRVFPICGEKTQFTDGSIEVINSCFPAFHYLSGDADGFTQPTCYGWSGTCSFSFPFDYYDAACSRRETRSPTRTVNPTPAPVVTTASPTPSPVITFSCEEYVTGCVDPLECGATATQLQLRLIILYLIVHHVYSLQLLSQLLLLHSVYFRKLNFINIYIVC